MNFTKYFLPPDVFTRHWLVAGEIQKGPSLAVRSLSVLDVGGSLSQLKQFLPRIRLTTADVVPTDRGLKDDHLVYDGSHLPLEDKSFHLVVSIDTLEHIPAPKRLDFIDELTRVAKMKVIIIAPFASPAHLEYEKELEKKLKQKEKNIPAFLAEHRKHGLVDADLLSQLQQKNQDVQLRLVGSVLIDKLNFNVHTFQLRHGKLNRLVYYIKLLGNLFVNLISPLTVKMTNNRIASRVLIVITRQTKQ